MIEEVQLCAGHINLRKGSAQKSMVFARGCRLKADVKFSPAAAQRAELSLRHERVTPVSGQRSVVSGQQTGDEKSVNLFLFSYCYKGYSQKYEVYFVAEEEP